MAIAHVVYAIDSLRLDLIGGLTKINFPFTSESETRKEDWIEGLKVEACMPM
jgi:hypothetical protein